MELKRRVGDRMCFALLMLGHIVTAVALSGVDNKTGLNLDCTNDFEAWMFCQFEAQNCSEYKLTLLSNDSYGEERCSFKQCDNGGCCCSVKMMLVVGETHTATVWKGGENMESKIISITDSRKPKTPNITSVKESDGNFEVMWTTNMENPPLYANVTYHKKGDTEKVSQFVEPLTVNGLKSHQIRGQDLLPSTTYLVSVKSYTNSRGCFSDSSEEWEFKTPKSSMSQNALLLTIIISLSIVAIILSGAIYGCYVKFKTKWRDTVVKCPNPKLLIMHPSKQEVLKPLPPPISSVCVVPDDRKSWSLKDTSSGSLQHSSGISTGSSCLSYANTESVDIIAGVQDALDKVFANMSPKSPLNTNPLIELNKNSGLLSTPYNPCAIRVDDVNSGPSCFDNKTYSIFLPIFPHQITMDSSEVQTQAEMLCDSAYRPSEGDIVICTGQQTPARPLINMLPVVSSLVPTDMSYQQCNTDSGRFSYAEDSSLSSVSSGTNTTASCDPVSRVEAGCESFDEGIGGVTKLNGKTEETTICDENPCYGCGPAGSHGFPPVDDDYQAFQNLVEQPDILFSEKRSGEKEERLNTFPEESFTKMPQSFISPVVPGFVNSVQGGQCLSELQRPFLSLIPAFQSMPVITDSGYQSVERNSAITRLF